MGEGAAIHKHCVDKRHSCFKFRCAMRTLYSAPTLIYVKFIAENHQDYTVACFSNEIELTRVLEFVHTPFANLVENLSYRYASPSLQ